MKIIFWIYTIVDIHNVIRSLGSVSAIGFARFCNIYVFDNIGKIVIFVCFVFAKMFFLRCCTIFDTFFRLDN